MTDGRVPITPTALSRSVARLRRSMSSNSALVDMPQARVAGSATNKPARQQSVGARDWDIHPDSISVGPLLGAGDYGAVYQGRWHGTPVAVKILKRDGAVNEDKLAAEIEVQRHIHHPNIIQFLGVCTRRADVAIVSELMDCGSLADALAHRPQPPLRRVLEIALDCARGLNYLHQANPHAIVHRDLKPANIMLASCRNSTAKTRGDALMDSAVVKVADFGLCRVMNATLPHAKSESCIRRRSSVTPFGCNPEPASVHGQSHADRKPSTPGSARGVDQRYQMTGGTGSLAFMACEVFRHEPYNAKADVYSLAMVMYEMLAGRRPFADMDANLAAMHAATDDLRPDWPAARPLTYNSADRAVWPQVKALVERCWAGTPARRCGPPLPVHWLQI
eukprot:jgi/Ulvmu1/11520/UM078_0009.1